MQYLPSWGNLDLSGFETEDVGDGIQIHRSVSHAQLYEADRHLTKLARDEKFHVLDMVLPSDSKRHYYLKGSVTFDENANYIREHLNSGTVVMQKDGTVRIMNKVVPKHQVKWLRDPRSGLITFNRAALWYVNREFDEMMLTFMNGAHVELPRLNRNRLFQAIVVARGILAFGEMHRHYYGMFHRSNVNTFSPVLYF